MPNHASFRKLQNSVALETEEARSLTEMKGGHQQAGLPENIPEIVFGARRFGNSKRSEKRRLME